MFGEPYILKRSGSHIHYWVSGPENKPVVMLTHGAILDHRMFSPQVEALARMYRVVTWDIPGHGQSQPAGRMFSIRRLSSDLLAILNRVGCSKVTLVGQSMGGDITQELLFRQPSRVSCVILIGCNCMTVRRGMSAELFARIAPIKLRFAPLKRLRRRMASAVTVTPQAHGYALEAMSTIGRQTMVSIWNAIAAGPHAEKDYTMPCPCLLLIGDQDELGGGVLRQGASQWAKSDCNCHLVMVPSAAHLANLDNPDFVNEQIITFLTQQLL